MNKVWMFSLLLMVFAGTLAASYCVCIHNGPCGCDNNRYANYNENITIWLNESQVEADYAYAQGTDIPAGERYDTFKDTREYIAPAEKRISIEILDACAQEGIIARTVYGRVPLGNVLLSLYSHAGGREFVSEVTTDSNGYGAFWPKENGKYDFVARKDEYNYGQKVFEIADCPYKFQIRRAPPILSDAPEQRVLSSREGENYARQIETANIANQKQAVKMRFSIFAQAGANQSRVLEERVSSQIAQKISDIGFEKDYPDEILQNENEIVFRWNVGKEYSGNLSREYILFGNRSGEDITYFEAPKIFDAQIATGAGAKGEFDYMLIAQAIAVLVILIIILALILVARTAFKKEKN
ncbi:MAG: hypothetical protein WC492_04795 [Candidatus Micrarchaeia archaeon]